MKVLVIDTALGACTVGVFDGDRPLAVRSEVMSKGHAEKIGGLVRDVVAEAGATLGGFEALDRIGVTVGPGSFTGLRVGLAFAQGLGAALDIPVVGISTLAALARTADAGVGDTAAIIDARRGQVYLQTFHDGVPDRLAEAIPVEAAGALLSAPRISRRLVGSGAILMDEAAADALVNPTAEALAALTLATHPDRAPPAPLYLRAPDAIPPTRLPGQPRPTSVRP
ncbi:tRNA (adenosine(37)-N6)-threonylcarbamoyltransferase complex dimerization subunit type 1 TsaB [soil metagenome]